MPTPHGFLLIDKPAGMTSHDVVDAVRRITGERRVGHAGTLDPFATGLLLVAIGKEATTKLSTFVGLDKTYEATFVLGQTSTTDDPEGVITETPSTTPPTSEAVLEALGRCTGEIEQIPPQYAAIKIQGKKMYELAREGKVVEAKPRLVHIESIELRKPITSTALPFTMDVRIRCGSGTYIRAIARDLGLMLSVGGYVQALRRTAIGKFEITQSSTLDQLQRSDWQKSLLSLT